MTQIFGLILWLMLPSNAMALVNLDVGQDCEKFKEPKFKPNAILDVDYVPNASGVIDMTRIEITGSLKDIADETDCRNVSFLSVLVSLDKEDKPFIIERADRLSEFHVTIDGLNDLCKDYNVGIRLNGTKGKLK